MENRSKAILYICTQCRKQGSIAKRLCKHDLEYERACKEWLASARALNEAREQMQRAGVHHQEERSHMQQQITELHDLLSTLGSNTTVPSIGVRGNEPLISCREVTVETGTVTVDRRSSFSESPSDEDHLPLYRRSVDNPLHLKTFVAGWTNFWESPEKETSKFGWRITWRPHKTVDGITSRGLIGFLGSSLNQQK